jgi:tetratricopeptide (TPR) repeat protein
MTAGAQRQALDAVHAARPIVARLSTRHNSEDLAADLIEAWNAIEGGLRSLVGGSALGGQMLIRELRTRHFLTLEQANALAEFHAARERAGRTGYTPTEGDVNAARDAFLKLEAGLMGEPVAAVPPSAATASVAAATVQMDSIGRRKSFTDAPPVAVPAATSTRPGWIIPVLCLLGVLGLGFVASMLFNGRSGASAAMDQGITAYREGRREAAQGAFNKAATDAPQDPMPHVYLSRMAREQNNLATANAEAVKAVQLGPSSGPALRELGSTLLAQQNFDGARTFYIRAIKADSLDRLSQGFLGCSLVRLGRLDEGNRWIQRAGTGSWSSCAVAPGVRPGMMPAQPNASAPPVGMRVQ